MLPKTKKIPLTQGRYAIVDTEDFERLLIYNWYIQIDKGGGTKVARTTHISLKKGKKKISKTLAYEILNLSPKTVCIHLNSNSLDFRKSNLLVCGHSTRLQHLRKRKNTASKFKGLYLNKGRGKPWVSRIRKDNIIYYLGHFDNEIDAALAYDEKAIELYGKDAFLNFGTPPSPPVQRTNIYPLNTIKEHRKRPHCNRTSKFKGVCFDKSKKRFVTTIFVNSRTKYLGSYENEIEAARVYDKEAKKSFGNNCYLNFPKG